MKRLMILAIAAVGATLASCNKSDLQISETGRPNELPVEVSLSAEALSRPGGSFSASTKSAAKADEGLVVDFGSADTKSTAELTTAEDSKVYNVWAIQFKSDGTLLGNPYYTDAIPAAGAGTPGSIDATYDLSVNLTTNTDDGKVYFIANTNSPSFFNATNAATEAKLKEVVKNIGGELKPTASTGIPMLGVYTGAVSSSAGISNVKMQRLVAKVILKYKVNAAFAGFEVTGVRLRNVPANMYFCAEQSGVFPAKADESHIDYPAEDLTKAIDESGYKKFVWYMPENLRGVASGVTDAGDRTLDKTDGCATYIEIKGTLKSPAKCEKAVYTVLLGDAAANKGDFNVKRNNVYTVTVDIQGTNASDNRITVESFDMNNCGMIPTGGTVTFDIRKCLKNTFTTESDFNTMLANKSWRVEVLWQDVAIADFVGITYNEPGAADDKSLGLFSVTTSSITPGNAVVALYDNATTGGEILWSWHIWVTKYHPDGSKAYGLDINSKATVPGGEVHTYGTEYQKVNGSKVIMDRDLGATKTYYNVPAADDANVIHTFGFVYQWGRKDPLPRWSGEGTMSSYKALTQTLYDATGTPYSDNLGYGNTDPGTNTNTACTESVTVTAGSGNSLEYSIKHPYTFITCADVSPRLKDWYTTDAANQNNDLWGDGAAKSAYDPCPKGWRVPANGTWSDLGTPLNDSKFQIKDPYAAPFWYYTDGEKLTAENASTFKQNVRNGRLYEAGGVKAWYPAPGYRAYISGLFFAVGQEECSWSSSAVTGSVDAHFLYFVQSELRTEEPNGRGFGLQVRCIQE